MISLARTRSLRRDERGQTLVEFAFVLPVFVLVVFGIVEMGRLVYTNSVLSQAAREGARVAAAEAGWIGVPGSGCVSHESFIGPANPGAHVCPADVPALRANVVTAANRMTVGVSPITSVNLSCNTGEGADQPPSGAWTDENSGEGNGCANDEGEAIASAGDLVSVRITYVYEPFVPLIDSIIGSVTLSSAATMAIH